MGEETSRRASDAAFEALKTPLEMIAQAMTQLNQNVAEMRRDMNTVMIAGAKLEARLEAQASDITSLKSDRTYQSRAIAGLIFTVTAGVIVGLVIYAVTK